MPTFSLTLKRHPWLRRIAKLVGGPVLHEQVMMWPEVGYWPNLRQPRSLNEKLAWTKLHQRDPRLPALSDKIAVRDYVRERLGNDYLIPLLATADRADDLDFDALPSAFALKANHGCGWVHLVRDKSAEALEALKHKANSWLKHRFGKRTGEWWYAPITPKLLVEDLLTDPDHPTVWEYKCWCFHGRVEYILVHYDRFNHHTTTFFDRDWKQMPFWRANMPGSAMPPPHNLDQLISAAERLAHGFDFIRVDLYQRPSGQLQFGELTFCPSAARAGFEPVEWDFRLGDLWRWPADRSAATPPQH